MNYSVIMSALSEYAEMEKAIAAKRSPVLVTGLSNIHKSHFVALTCDKCNKILVVTPDEASAVRLLEDITVLAPHKRSVLYPARDFVFHSISGASREYEYIRLNVLNNLLSGEIDLVVTSIEAALQHTIPPDKLKTRSITLQKSHSYNISDLLDFLVTAGYEHADQVEGAGQFSHRGGILDIFSPQLPNPVRIEFWDDEIDTMAFFEVDTQRRTDTVEEIILSPAREILFDNIKTFTDELKNISRLIRTKNAETVRQNVADDIEKLENGLSLDNMDKYAPILYKQSACLLDYMPDCRMFVSEMGKTRDTFKNSIWQISEDIKTLFEQGILFKGLDRYYDDFESFLDRCHGQPTIILDTFAQTNSDLRLRELLDVNAMQLSNWSGEFSMLKEDIAHYIENRYCILIYAGTDKGAKTICQELVDEGFPAALYTDQTVLHHGKIYLTEGSLSAGMEYPSVKLAVISHSKTANVRKKTKSRHKSGEQIRSLSDLKQGDLIVHISHGIGIFEGIVKQDIQNIIKDYIKIRYAGTDTLFVPVTQLDLVSKYIGPKDESTMRLNRLNSADWQKTKARVKKAVADMAKELIKLYAERAKLEGYSFSPDTLWQTEFEEKFPFDETEDQLRCIDEIKHDMERMQPMERLLCGDVGFGKTEVAIRAAFKCVMDSKQCAIVVPTTILAWQHFKTLKSRMEGYPINIDVISRFRKPKQQEQIIRELGRGQIDIIVGTHRLLQKDVEFKDLGLVIIDEEQRFGVRHKEKLKEVKKNVDILTLSATPIPRTLNMAMSGVRDMSVIEQAPSDRYPVQTYVVEHNWGIITEALKRELRRDGQVFYLHNRVETIESCASTIARLVPEARIVTAHGKMSEQELSDVWQQLVDHEIDILVCTTIIETGVDVANCNTLIIEDADRMGLSQLYQIRGRVGRSNRRAFAYFTFRKDKQISEVATKRLSAIREFTTFGSGFRIAMRDLEIRGAGNILGAEQHGQMEAVGYDMYIKLLGEAVAEEKGDISNTAAPECLVDIQISAHIPNSYIENLSARIDVYKKIASIRNEQDALDVTDELIDRFGEPPRTVKGLIDVALVRNAAATVGVYEIQQREDDIFFFAQTLDFERIGRLSSKFKGRVRVNGTGKTSIVVKVQKKENPIDIIRDSVIAMLDNNK